MLFRLWCRGVFLIMAVAVCVGNANALPEDLDAVGRILDESPQVAVQHKRPAMLDMKNVSSLLFRHPELKNPPVANILKNPFDVKSANIKGYMRQEHWPTMQAWIPDKKMISAAFVTPEYSVGMYVVKSLASPWGMFFATCLLACVVWFALAEKLVVAGLLLAVYLVWTMMPIIRYATAWWL